MSYRSKRTRALTPKDDETEVVKKPTSNVPVTSTTSTGVVNAGGVRWGPFKPPNGKPQLGQNLIIQKTLSIPKQQNPNTKATLSNNVIPSRPHSGCSSDTPSNINESSLLETTKTAPNLRNDKTEASRKKILLVGSQKSSLGKYSQQQYSRPATYPQIHSNPVPIEVSPMDQESPIWKNPVTRASNTKTSLMRRQGSSLDKDFEKTNPSKGPDPMMLQKKQCTGSPSFNIHSIAGPQTHSHPSQTCDIGLNREKDSEIGKLPKEPNPMMFHKNRSSASLSIDIQSFAGPQTHEASLPQSTRSNKTHISRSQTHELRPSNQNRNPNNLSHDVEVIPKDQELPNARKETFTLKNGQQTTSNNARELFKPRRRNLMPDWPDEVEFDEDEDVVTIDAEGNYCFVSGYIQPNDVWHANGVKYFVNFNEFHQPLKKGGHILVRFIGHVAKQEQFCPIRETNWQHVKPHLKVEIIKLIRSRFVIPDGDCYNQGILKRMGKSMRNYRHSLKKQLFKPTTLTKEQIYQSAPSGHPRDSWIELVDYWYGKGQRYSDCGKEARALQNHVHTSGAKSYANIRASFEEKNNREPSVLEMFRSTHQKKDGTFAKDTLTEDFLDDADANVYTEMVMHPTSTKSRVEIENEAFNKLMYGDDIPKRPVGYGFGVNQSDVFGVRSILRKEKFHNAENDRLKLQDMETKVANLTKINEGLIKQNQDIMKTNNTNQELLKKVLDLLSTGTTSTEVVNLAKNILHATTTQEPTS